jgi:acetyltransferase-like isoleucine patch superfamily enzyme
LIDERFLESRYWTFHRPDGEVAAQALRLLPGGAIGGYHHPNEAFWRLEGQEVVLLDVARVPTLRLSVDNPGEHPVRLSGPHIPDPTIVLCLSEAGISKPEFIAGARLRLGRCVTDFGWRIGDHTYGHPSILEHGRAPLIIGKYGSIADGVKISLGDHRTDGVSSYPFGSFQSFWPSYPQGVASHTSKGAVVIGNDVWIGADVFIGSGVTIGDGAVIGARSVVTKDVPPYAVAVGAPAGPVRYRFPQSIIDQLLQLAWWDLPDETVDRLLPWMMSTDIQAFISEALTAKQALADA